MRLVSAVGGGTLGFQLDLDSLASDLDVASTKYDPTKHNGLIARFHEDGPAIIFYRSGAYSISGADSLDELEYTFDKLNKTLHELLDSSVDYNPTFEVRNIVYSGKYGNGKSPGSIDLKAVCMGLGFDVTEYEPEQFPGVFYRPDDLPGIYLIFSTGSVMLTGVADTSIAVEAFEEVIRRIGDVLEINP
ncbi:hypothetical protein ACFR99_18865 [Haloarchaeobius amylolyticus]|uniref:TATA-box-binding protein n=1 Tax=Haloarchaeobius amylolyticus TaxID=1198296 RepID=A0ABD6BKY1_9EURY